MAAPVLDDVVNANPNPNGSSKTITGHVMGSGSGGLVVVQVISTNQQTHASATYGGQAMTRELHIQRGGISQRMSFWYLENPPTGANSFVINFGGGMYNPIAVHIRSFTGSDGVGNKLQKGAQGINYVVAGSTYKQNDGRNVSTGATFPLTVSQDSRIMMMSASSGPAFHATYGMQIPKDTNLTYYSASTTKQVALGAVSAGLNAGSIDLRAVVVSGTCTCDRIEIKGTSGGGGSTRRIIIV